MGSDPMADDPTVADGAFAMTNQIVSAVSEVSSGKALVVPPRFAERNSYCEMVFTWKPSPDCAEDRELVVRGYANGKRQMAVCCCLHTKGDGIKAGFALLPDRMMPAQRTRRSASLPRTRRGASLPRARRGCKAGPPWGLTPWNARKLCDGHLTGW